MGADGDVQDSVILGPASQLPAQRLGVGLLWGRARGWLWWVGS